MASRRLRPFDLIRLALAVVATVLVSLTFRVGEKISAVQPVEFFVRPIEETSVVLIQNPINARDADEASAAGGSWQRVCKDHCTKPIVATATWLRMPGGYRPLRLEVKWLASSFVGLYGSDTSKVKATLEYNLGNGWQSWIEYTWFGNSSTCPSPPDGSITCPNHVDTLSLQSTQHTETIQVRVTESVELTHCDNCWLRVSNVSGSLSVYDIRVKADDCYLPTGETTVGEGWDDPGDSTVHKFMQTLVPPSSDVNFNGRLVKEKDHGGGGPDSCHKLGDLYDPFEAITGGAWIVNSANKYGDDYVGYHSWVVDWYRQQQPTRMPCGTSFQQDMVIVCGSTTEVLYRTNTLGASIDALTVTSERNGVQQLRTY